MRNPKGFRKIEEVVDRGTAAVAEAHKQISGAPFEVIEKFPSVADSARKARSVHDQVIDGIYGSIRRINRALFDVAETLFGTMESPQKPSPRTHEPPAPHHRPAKRSAR